MMKIWGTYTKFFHLYNAKHGNCLGCINYSVQEVGKLKAKLHITLLQFETQFELQGEIYTLGPETIRCCKHEAKWNAHAHKKHK